MGDVFAKADRVVIWLGEGCSQSASAFLLLKKFYAYAWRTDVWQVTWSKAEGATHLTKKFVAKTIRQIILQPFLDEPGWESEANFDLDMKKVDWACMRALLRRPWFHRLWVVQEVSNARRAIVVCGHKEISWTVLAAVLEYLVENELIKYVDPVCIFACSSVMSIQKMRYQRTRDPLFTVILDNMYGGCRDPKDKIFAMMSLSVGHNIFDWEISFDLSLSADELYKRFAIWDVVRNKTLRVLSCATAATKRLDLQPPLPSWVPDWRLALDPNLLVRVNNTSIFSAGLGKEGGVWFTNDKSLIHVEGAIVDSLQTIGAKPFIVKTTSLFEIDQTAIEYFVNMRSWETECWLIAKGDQPMTLTIYNRFWRTMLCDLDSDGKPAPKSYSKYFLSYLEYIREAPGKFGDILDSPGSVVPYGLTIYGKIFAQAVSLGLLSASFIPGSCGFLRWCEQNLQTNTLIERSLQKWGTNKRFCRTQDGRLARVPISASVNDLICILHTSEVPYVLRSQEDGTYTVIGECYVHELMHGEAFELESYSPEIFRLR